MHHTRLYANTSPTIATIIIITQPGDTVDTEEVTPETPPFPPFGFD